MHEQSRLSGDQDEIDPMEYLKNLPPVAAPPQPKEAIDLVKDALRGGEVLFYPACHLDWRPIVRFQLEVSTFVYCDWCMTMDDFLRQTGADRQNPPMIDGMRFNLAHQRQVESCDLGGAAVDLRQHLSAQEWTRYQHDYRRFANQHHWGLLLNVNIVVPDRKVHLVYFCAEGVKTYLELFSAPRPAPRSICIYNPGVSYTNFRDYTHALGRAVDANPDKSNVLVTDPDHPHNWWPWSEGPDEFGRFRRPQ